MITRDNKETKKGICREIGVFRPNEDINRKSLTRNHPDKKSVLRKTRELLFSRVEPKHKQEMLGY